MGGLFETFARIIAFALLLLVLLGVLLSLTAGLRWSDYWLAVSLIILLVGLPLTVLYFLQSYATLSLTTPFRIPFFVVPLITAVCIGFWFISGPLYELRSLRKERAKIERYRASLGDVSSHGFHHLSRIARLVGKHAGDPREIETPAREGLEKFESARTHDEKTAAIQELARSFREFAALMEVYPEIRDDHDIRKALIRLLDDDAIKFRMRRRRLERTVQEYNESLAAFPTFIVARVAGLKKLDTET